MSTLVPVSYDYGIDCPFLNGIRYVGIHARQYTSAYVSNVSWCLPLNTVVLVPTPENTGFVPTHKNNGLVPTPDYSGLEICTRPYTLIQGWWPPPVPDPVIAGAYPLYLDPAIAGAHPCTWIL